jgi:pyruvate, water dikinase
MSDKWIYRLTEIGMDHNDVVGKKCANLGELTKGSFRVPPGFALGVDAYERFLNETGIAERIQKHLDSFKADPEDIADTMKFDTLSEEIRSMIEVVTMPSYMEKTIREYYQELCRETGQDNVFVATRSAGPKSHPGQYETFLNVSGEEDVLKNIIKVWASTFNTRSIISRARLNLPIHTDPIGVAVLTMVDAKAAGVIFTVNPVNGDESKVAIEASFGFGEAVVSGNVTPDRYLVDKVTLEIDERVVSDKGAEFAYNPETRTMEYKDLPKNQRKIACLEEREVIELTQIAKKVEAHFGCPQDIEYSISKTKPFPESIFLVQARPESVWGKKKKESVLGKKSGFELLFEKATTPIKLYDRDDGGRILSKEKILVGKRILIVDDEPDILEVLEESLTPCDVAKASNFSSAKELLETKAFDLAILDIMGVNGYDLLEIANSKNIPAVMLTAHAFTPESLFKSMKEGAVAYLPKEEINGIDEFLIELFEAKEKGLSPLAPWENRYPPSYFSIRFGAAWKAADKEFLDQFKEILRQRSSSKK